MVIIAASILAADFTRLGEELAEVEAAGADWIHVDITDGHFVPNLTMGPMTVEAVRRATSLPIDVHLLIADPDVFIERFAAAGATRISVHAEASADLVRSLDLVRRCGAIPGIALGPAAPLSLIEAALEHADYVDLLAVHPGFGGQDYIPATMGRLRYLRSAIRERGLPILLQSDGGINMQTIGEFSAAGVDAFVVGSAIFGKADYGPVIRELRGRADAAARDRSSS